MSLQALTPTQRKLADDRKARLARMSPAAPKPSVPAAPVVAPIEYRIPELTVVWSAPKPPTGALPVESIIKLVCRVYNIPRNDLISLRRDKGVIQQRHIAMFLARILTLRSLPEIARMFGGRDHTTILNAVRKISAHIKVDPTLMAEIDQLCVAIRGYPPTEDELRLPARDGREDTWLPMEDETLRRCTQEGRPAVYVARQLRRTTAAIYRRAQVLRTPFKGKAQRVTFPPFAVPDADTMDADYKGADK